MKTKWVETRVNICDRIYIEKSQTKTSTNTQTEKM